MNLQNFESRTATPITIKLTESDRSQLIKISQTLKIPHTRLAYIVLRNFLEQHQNSIAEDAQ